MYMVTKLCFYFLTCSTSRWPFRNTKEFVQTGIPIAHVKSSLSFIPVEPPLDMHCLSFFSPQRRQYVLYEYVKGSPRNFWKSHPSQAPMSVHKNYTVDGSEAISLRRLNETLQLHRWESAISVRFREVSAAAGYGIQPLGNLGVS